MKRVLVERRKQKASRLSCDDGASFMCGAERRQEEHRMCELCEAFHEKDYDQQSPGAVNRYAISSDCTSMEIPHALNQEPLVAIMTRHE